ncbi:MAG: hypothetical protein JNK02_04135 [Planctomycetes bacterium]|nr:hypothetical protein [Planctomycetota bacterium]
MNSHVVSLLVWIAASSANALATNQYALDDGSPNSGLSYGIAGDFCWFQSFTTVGATDGITSVQVMWQPGQIPAGTAVRLCVWEDPNDDHNPADAILVRSVAATVPSLTLPLTYTTYALGSPAIVQGGFFIGAVLTTDGSLGTIALLDYDSGLSGRAWFATDAPGFFDPALLSSSFYNHIETLGAGIHGVYLLRAQGSGDVPLTYCTAKVNSLGCTPQIGAVGAPSASSGSGFLITATSVRNLQSGILFYGTNGRSNAPFLGGTLCVQSPLRRTGIQNAGGSVGSPNCTGVYHFDFNAWVASGVDPLLVAGTTVNCQFYSRDPGFAPPNNIGLSDALEFTLQP